MAKNQWVIERLSPSENDDVEWDSFNLGIVEEGFFRTVGTFFSEEDALKFKGSVEWLETLEEFTISAAPVPAIKPRTKARSRSKT